MTVWILLCHLCLHLCVLVCCCDAILVLVGVILPGVLVVLFVDCLNGGGTIGGTVGVLFLELELHSWYRCRLGEYMHAHMQVI